MHNILNYLRTLETWLNFVETASKYGSLLYFSEIVATNQTMQLGI